VHRDDDGEGGELSSGEGRLVIEVTVPIICRY
jgi:hypothetical protein